MPRYTQTCNLTINNTNINLCGCANSDSGSFDVAVVAVTVAVSINSDTGGHVFGDIAFFKCCLSERTHNISKTTTK